MAKFRPLYTKIWADADFQEYTPEQKLIFIYLCTNEKTSESGIYPISFRTIANELGIPYETVSQLLANGLLKNVSYDEKHNLIFVKNFLKYNGSGRPDLVSKAIKNDSKVYQSCLWNLFIQAYPEHKDNIIITEPLTNSLPIVIEPPITPSNPISNANASAISIIPQPLANSSITIKDIKTTDTSRIFKYYENNFGLLSSGISERVKDLMDTYSEQWVMDAMQIAVDNEKRNIAYFSKILERWHTEGRNNNGHKTITNQPQEQYVKYKPVDSKDPEYLKWLSKQKKV